MVTKARLDLIIRELGLSGRAFEKECGLANGSYSSIRDGVGADKLKKILIRYPQISAEWLLTGRGEMLKAVESENTGSEAGGGKSREYSNPNPLKKENMKDILLQMTGLISGQQQDLSRLITELERNGNRSDRVLDLIEQNQGVAHKGDSKKKSELA